MISEMAKYSKNTDYTTNKSNFKIKNKEIKTENYHIMNGDCVTEIKKIKDNAVDLIIFSPPFAELYVYSDKEEDRKSTRLNSSHVAISYAVFCLKKKKR